MDGSNIIFPQCVGKKQDPSMHSDGAMEEAEEEEIESEQTEKAPVTLRR